MSMRVRRPTRDAVVRALRDLEILFGNPDPQKEAPADTEATLETKPDTANYKPVEPELKGGER